MKVFGGKSETCRSDTGHVTGDLLITSPSHYQTMSSYGFATKNWQTNN